MNLGALPNWRNGILASARRAYASERVMGVKE